MCTVVPSADIFAVCGWSPLPDRCWSNISETFACQFVMRSHYLTSFWSPTPLGRRDIENSPKGEAGRRVDETAIGVESRTWSHDFSGVSCSTELHQ